jgi:hypothetical protein
LWAILVPVLYGETEADYLIHDFLSCAEKFCLDDLTDHKDIAAEDWVADFSRYWMWACSFYAPMIKHEAFRDEREWRIIYHLKVEDFPRMKFLQRTSMMTRHLPLPLRAAGEMFKPLLPLMGVIVGPTSLVYQSQIAVNTLLRSRGYPTAISAGITSLPYRPVL